MHVIPCGTEVTLAGTSLRGTVLAICVRGTLVTYEVVWFVGDARHTAWLQESELSVDGGVRRVKMGL